MSASRVDPHESTVSDRDMAAQALVVESGHCLLCTYSHTHTHIPRISAGSASGLTSPEADVRRAKRVRTGREVVKVVLTALSANSIGSGMHFVPSAEHALPWFVHVLMVLLRMTALWECKVL